MSSLKIDTQSCNNRNTCTAFTCLYLTSIEIEILHLLIYMDNRFLSISNMAKLLIIYFLLLKRDTIEIKLHSRALSAVYKLFRHFQSFEFYKTSKYSYCIESCKKINHPTIHHYYYSTCIIVGNA